MQANTDIVLITGSSSGFGEACARAFAQAGRELLLIARRKDRLVKLGAELARDYGIQCHCIALDVRRRAEVDAFAQNHAEWLTRVDVLINNAGLARGLSTLQEADVDDWESMIDTNIKGLLYITRHVVGHMVSRRVGHIINIGSVAGHWVYPKGNVYCATKFAVRALTEGLRMDVNGTGIRVTEVSPGMAETEFSEVRLGNKAKAKAVYAGMTPLRAVDVAEAVLWCVSRPSHVNIQELVLYPTDQASPTLVTRR